MQPFELPALAIETIAKGVAATAAATTHLPDAGASRGAGHDPRRCTLPLVSREWRQALDLAPELWERVEVCTSDLFPSSNVGPSTCCPPRLSGAAAPCRSSPGASLCRWFATRAGQVRRLTIHLDWRNGLCSPADLQQALACVLASCAAGLESLQLEVAGAPLLACRVWTQATACALPGAAFPALQELELSLEGSPACSEAANTQAAERALLLAAAQQQLRRLGVRLRGIKLLRLPTCLERMPELHSLGLLWDPQVLAPLLPAASGLCVLPPTLHRLELGHPPVRATAAMQLAGKLPLLQRFRLVTAAGC